MVLRIRDFWPTSRLFTRISEPALGASALGALASRYHSDETDMIYTVRLVDDKLKLSWPRQYDIALDAIGGHRFLSSMGTVTFTRDAAGAVNGLAISNRRLRPFQAQRLALADAAPR